MDDEGIHLAMDLEPAISPDGSSFYFMSKRPDAGDPNEPNEDIWTMDRVGEGWGEPRRRSTCRRRAPASCSL